MNDIDLILMLSNVQAYAERAEMVLNDLSDHYFKYGNMDKARESKDTFWRQYERARISLDIVLDYMCRIRQQLNKL